MPAVSTCLHHLGSTTRQQLASSATTGTKPTTSTLVLLWSLSVSITTCSASPAGPVTTETGGYKDITLPPSLFRRFGFGPEQPEAPSHPNSSQLPYQIGAIAGAYGVTLLLVAILLLLLSRNRRQALSNADKDLEEEIDIAKQQPPALTIVPPQSPRSIPRSPVRNFSYPSPERTEFFPSPQTPYIAPSPSSTLGAPGVDIAVDQRVVAADRNMAQSQLEEMYKHVMEQDEAKQQGIILQGTPVLANQPRASTTSDKSTSTLNKKEKSKPAQLDLAKGSEDKQSRTSSILSALRSPRKKKDSVKGVNISSPMMTPQSATFPGGRQAESREMSTIPPRHYAPPAPPPVPTDQVPSYMPRSSQQSHQGHQQMSPVTPGQSPESTQSIDERIGRQLPVGAPPSGGHSRNISRAPTEVDPISASSDNSHTPLVSGLPASPRAKSFRGSGPSLPSSPKPGASFQRPNAPSAVRTGGALPLRAYEPPMASPSMAPQTTTKQTTFERVGPISPMSARTPATGTAVPYSPYQPFTPCVPLTPSLVTKADRKRMKKLEPKTPTMEMVRDNDDVW